MHKLIVSVVKSVQLRTEYVNGDGKVKGWNTRYMKPTQAAMEWARTKNSVWEHRRFDKGNGAYYHDMTPEDWEYSRKREERLYRRSLPIFQAMLA